MPPIPQRAQIQIEEALEQSVYGPFGGIQSEVSLDLVEQYGFVDSLNMILLRSMATVRSNFETLPAFPTIANEPIMGIADFYDVAGTRVQVVMTPTRLIMWDPATQNWHVVPDGGSPLTGGNDDLFSWTVVNNKLCFCQGVDKVKIWDGDITHPFADASMNAVPARYLFELNTHLVACYTIETSAQTQRVRWTAAGDPTDWTGPDAGVNDVLGDLGPITNCSKVFQTGYITFQWGITQMIPTGQAAAPFQFVPLTTRARGNTVPFALAPSGEEFFCYVGKDNVYVFNGTNSQPIGDLPVQGGRRIGARTRIFADLALINQQRCVGYISDNINGRNYPAYWLVIPTIAVWVYNFDEGNWTRFSFTKQIKTIGRFFRETVIRIEDLIGSIASQQWTPDTLASENPFDAVLLGTLDGNANLVNFTGYSEQPWLLSGVFVMQDPRHSKTVKKFRLVFTDNGPVTVSVALTNQLGQTQTQVFTAGTGSGNDISIVLGFNINGIRINWSISGAAGVPFQLVEFCPMFQIGGEQRGGTVDA